MEWHFPDESPSCQQSKAQGFFLLNIVLHHQVSDNILLVHKSVFLFSDPICTFGVHDMLRHHVMKCNYASSGDLSFAGFELLD